MTDDYEKHIKLLTIGTLLLGGLTGCNDFLDRKPLDKVIPKIYRSESDWLLYIINAYPFETVTTRMALTSSAKITILIIKPAVTPRILDTRQKKVPSGEATGLEEDTCLQLFLRQPLYLSLKRVPSPAIR
ncbi:hypothetical protein [Bacteroides acidifaciens]|uniref:hypothetical protein n=1 Tax=Bacteroides acidifaciens TaxID=85831 RepID=UPI003F68BBE5